jgi:hypothetical protein
MPNFESVDFIVGRAQATREVQEAVAQTWMWGDKSLAQWDADIAAVKQARTDEIASHAAEQETRGQRDVAYTQLERRMIQAVASLKIRARRNPAHAPLIANLPEDKNTRASILARALAVAEAWRQIDPTLVTSPGQTLSVFDGAILDIQQHDAATIAAKVAWRAKAEALADKASELDTDAKDWYSLATRQMLPGTPAGDLLRSRIPTTAVAAAPAPPTSPKP